MRFEVRVVTGSSADGGFVGVQSAGFGGADGAAELYPSMNPFGFLSRPLDPEVDEEGQVTGDACNVLVAEDGSEGFTLPTEDRRVLSKLPVLSKGGSVQYGATGTWSLIDGGDGTVTVYVPYEFDESGTPTRAHLFRMSASPSAPSCVFQHGDGQNITLNQEGKIIMASPSGATMFILSDDAIDLVGTVNVSGILKAAQGPGLPVLTGSPPGVPSTTLFG